MDCDTLAKRIGHSPSITIQKYMDTSIQIQKKIHFRPLSIQIGVKTKRKSSTPIGIEQLY